MSLKGKTVEKTSWIREKTWMTLSACIWLGLFPLLNFGTYTTLTMDKWKIMVALFGTTVGCFIADYYAHNTSKPQKTFSFLICFLFFWIALSCLLSQADPIIWWTGINARREGLGTQLCYLVLSFLFSCSQINRKLLLGSSATGVLFFGVIVVLQRMGYNPFGLYPLGLNISTNPEFQGTIGNIDMCTGYLVLVFGILNTDNLYYLISHFRKPQRQTLRFNDTKPFLLSLCGTAMALYLILTMEVQFGIVSLVCYILYLVLRMIPRSFRPIILFFVPLIGALIIWFFPFEQGALWELHEILHGRAQLSFGSNRLAAWHYSLQLGKENLLFGGGSGTFMQRLASFLKENGYKIPSAQGKILIPTTFDNPHNEYIAIFVNHGLPALVLYIALIMHLSARPLMEKEQFMDIGRILNDDNATGQNHQNRMTEDFRGGIICYATQSFFSFSVCIVAPLFWIALGILATYQRGLD